MDTHKFLFEFFENPIIRISHMLSRYDLDDESSNVFWGGETPVLLFTVESRNDERSIVVAGRDFDLRFRELDSSDDVITQAERFVAEELAREQKFICTASLDTVVNPVPGWHELKTTSITVIEEDRNLLGFSLTINLGTRIGVFVTPNPGVTLTYNEQCDIIVGQARQLHEAKKIAVTTRTFIDRETPKQFQDIDWFDWLRTRP